MTKISQSKANGRLPNLIIIGAAKCGTTSLHYYLSLHPEIFMSRLKEPRFFVDAPEPLGRWNKGTDWYRGLFRSSAKICGEASPAYTSWRTAQGGVVERMHRLIPEAKLIYLVREPMEKLRSAYLMASRRAIAKGSFQEFLESSFGQRARHGASYGTQMQRYLQRFPREQIILVESSSLHDQRSETLRKIFRFLAVEPEFYSPLFRHRRHVSWHEPYLTPFGHRLLSSSALRAAKCVLPRNVFDLFRNIAFRPFSTSPPPTNLSKEFECDLRKHLAQEVSLLRELSAQPLASLQA
jgi:hypothetical protein